MSHPVLIIAESIDDALAPSTPELVAAGASLAAGLATDLVAVVVGSGIADAAAALARLGPSRVIAVDDPSLAAYNPEVTLATLEDVARDVAPAAMLALHGNTMRELTPRLSYRLGLGLVTDCTAARVEGGQVVYRKPVYGGSAIAEYASATNEPTMATMRMRVTSPAEPGPTSAPIEQRAATAVAVRVRLVETAQAPASAGPRLKDAKTVVSGGRGVGGPDNWHHIESLAGALGAAVGATRAVTDAGWVAPSMQVGLTGITITPDLYVTVAVSGAVQHIAGCSGSRNIVAINKDPDANIFKHARFGIVGDYQQIVPALTARVRELLA
jgi:electron transfer flavoprotein alpha subunit